MTVSLRFFAQLLLGLTSFAVYGTLAALDTRGGVLTSIVLVALLTFVAILLHELAHAGAAHVVGARVHAIVAIPFRLRFRPRRLDLIGRGGRGDLGGYVSYALDRIDPRRKRALIAAAGPLANLLLALIAGTLAPWLDTPAVPFAAPIICFAFAVLSGGLGLANLIPYQGSDGDHIFALWRRG